MRARIRDILTNCIETGIECGWNKVHKHTDKPEERHIFDMIDHYIWLEIDAAFSFDEEYKDA